MEKYLPQIIRANKISFYSGFFRLIFDKIDKDGQNLKTYFINSNKFNKQSMI